MTASGAGGTRPDSALCNKALALARLYPKGKLVRLAGIEPTTLGFGGQYSIH